MADRRALAVINGEVQEIPDGDVVVQNPRTYVFGVENPISNDDIPRFKVPRAFTVERIVATKFGGAGSFDWELRHSVNANDQGAGTLIHSDTGVNNETTGVVYTTPADFAAVTIPADDWVWLELPVVSTGLARPVAMSVQMYGSEA